MAMAVARGSSPSSSPSSSPRQSPSPRSRAGRRLSSRSSTPTTGAGTPLGDHHSAAAVRVAESWILKLDQEHGINMYHGMPTAVDRDPGTGGSGRARGGASAESSSLFEQRFQALKQRLMLAPHDKLLTYLVMRQHGNFQPHNYDPQNARMVLGFPASAQFLSAFTALAAMQDDDTDIGGCVLRLLLQFARACVCVVSPVGSFCGGGCC